jgi:2-(1,2-epoxy-1,2-dihydrophenyl)acetyl-CoA isomerase
VGQVDIRDRTTHFYRHALRDVEAAISAGEFAAGFVVDNPLPDELPVGGVFEGPDGLRAYLAQLGEHLKIERFSIERIVAGDGEAIVFGSERSSWIPQGGAYEMEWVHVLTFDAEGRYARLREYNDTARMVEALRGASE